VSIFIDGQIAFRSPQGKVLFQMGKKKQKTLKDLKENLFFAPLWKVPNFIKLFKVHIDASDFIIRGVFMQDGHPITLRTKNSMECN
jgi:hypothetical protein